MTIGVGIVGSGFMGRTWANVAATGDRTRLAGVSGGRRAAALAEDLGCPLVASVQELIEDETVELVVLATPPGLHLEQTLACAGAGKSVLVEKPMAQSVSECDEMVAACSTANVVLAVVSQHRFRDAPRRAQELIAEGRVGAVNMVRVLGPAVGWWDVEKTQDAWKLDPSEQTAYASWGAHACDLVRWFVGSEPDLAFAIAAHYSSDPPSGRSVMASYRFKSGAMAQLWMSYDIPLPGLGSGLQLLIIGDRGMIELDCYGAVRLGDENGWSTVYQETEFDALDPSDTGRLKAYALELDDVVAAMLGHRGPLVDGDEGRRTTAMLEAAQVSAASGEAVSLPVSR